VEGFADGNEVFGIESACGKRTRVMVQPYLSKYPAEFVLDFNSDDRFIFRASDLYHLAQHISPELLERVDKCQIYLVGKRPHISLIPDSIHMESDALGFQIQYKLGGAQHCTAVKIPRRLFRSEEVSFEASPSPHRGLISRNCNGEILGETLLVNFVHLFPTIDSRARDLEIIYAGKGLRPSAYRRLMKHETLQEILAGIHSNEPESEVFILLYHFQYKKNLLLSTSQAEINGNLARLHAERAMTYRPPNEEQISVIEASLITHFQPEFNRHYLVFPNHKQAILENIYETDIAAVLVQLDNANIGGQRIYSKNQAPNSIHNIVIDFRRLEDKPSWFP
jgi:hypothetical protein